MGRRKEPASRDRGAEPNDSPALVYWHRPGDYPSTSVALAGTSRPALGPRVGWCVLAWQSGDTSGACRRGRQVHLAPDGMSVLYARTEHGVGNIWSAPLDGRPPKRLTAFDSELIFSFAVSPDNRLVISRGIKVSDVVLISNIR
jgi:hypothetical protein